MTRMAMFSAILLSAIGLITANFTGFNSPSSRPQLKTWCTNVKKGEKLVIRSSDTTLQSACDLRTEITPMSVGTLTLTYSVLPLTDMVRPGDLEGNYMGLPKVYRLVNKTEEFGQSNLYAIRSVILDDISLSGLRGYLDGSCGTVYLAAALRNGSEIVSHTVIRAKMECPDESDVDLVPVVTADDSWMMRPDQVIVINQKSPNISVRLFIQNNGSQSLSARTDPDALKVWVYLKQVYIPGTNAVVPLNMSTFEVMPSAGDVMVSIDNIFNRKRPGSPAIEAGSTAELSLTQLRIPDNLCGDGVLVISVDPLGEISDALRSNNVVGIRVYSDCRRDITRCHTYSTPQAGVSLVALHHSYSPEPANLVELRAATGEIRQMNTYSMTANERLDMVKAVGLSHAIQAEANRLQAIGSCDFSAGDMEAGLSWHGSVLGRLSQSLMSVRRSLSTIKPASEFESDQLDLLSTMAETIGQLMQQRGSIRTILSTIIHGDMSMFSGGRGRGDQEGSGSGGSGGGFSDGGNQGQDSYSGGYHSWNWDSSDNGYSHGYSGGSGYYSGYSGGSGHYSDYSGGSGHYSDYSGGSGHYSDYSGGSGHYSDYSGGSGDYSDYSGSGSGDYNDYSGSGSGDYSDYSGSGSGDYNDYSGSGSGDYNDYSGSGSGDYSDYSGSGSGDYSDYSGSGSGDYSDYSGSSGDFSDYSDYYGSSDYSDYSDYGSSDYSDYGGSSEYTDGTGPTLLEPLQLERRKRFVMMADMFDRDNDEGSGYGGMNDDMRYDATTHGYSGMDQAQWNHGMNQGEEWNNGRRPDPNRAMAMMAPVMRLQMFFAMVGEHMALGDYKSFRLPGCFSEEFNDNFRRFLKAGLWRTMPVQQIPGYEEVSDDFVFNVRRLIKLLSSGKVPIVFDGRLPDMFKERMSRWIGGRGGINPMLPLPEDLLVSALKEVANISRNFTTNRWEGDTVMKNQSMVLFGKVAGALLNNSRGEGLDMFTQAALELQGLLASGDMAEATGTTYNNTMSSNDMCKRMVELSVKEDAGRMNTPMVVMRDGDVYSIRPSPLTGEMLWKKVVACQCSRQDNPWRAY